jgi:hypothetical protein
LKGGEEQNCGWEWAYQYVEEDSYWKVVVVFVIF